jgi:beta-lactamase class A
MNTVSSDHPDKKKTTLSKFIYIPLILVLGVAIGYLLGYLTNNTQETPKDKDPENFSEVRSGGYVFTNPLLDCDNFHPSILKSHVRLKKELNEYVDNTLKKGTATHISVYLRLMNNGPWIGINEDAFYSPASLLKVPLLIAVLKRAETEDTLLKQRILYDKPLETELSSDFIGSKSLKVGSTYTVDELLEYMIIYSDNNARLILMNLVGDQCLLNVESDLGVNLSNKDLSIDFISVKEYSSFFRILYNASYLNRNMSEKALELLSRVQFNEGIPKKLPKDIKISHKFGERAFGDSDIKQLHDCGIVYVPGNPYLLCIMTKGTDFDPLIKIISDISEIVYKNVSAQ